MTAQEAVLKALGNVAGYVVGFHGDKVTAYEGIAEAYNALDAEAQGAFVENIMTKGLQRLAQEAASTGDDLQDAQGKVAASKALAYRLGARVGVAKLSPIDKEVRAIVASLLGNEDGRKIAATLVGRTVPVNKKSEEFKTFVSDLAGNEKVVAKAEKRVKENLKF